MTDNLRAELRLAFADAGGWLDKQLAQLAEHDLLPIRRTAEAAQFQSAHGCFEIQAGGSELRVWIESPDASGLEVLQETVSFYLLSHDRALAERMAWQGDGRGETRPANFREMTVAGRRLVSPWMIRLTLQGRDLASFAERGLHIRLLVPPAGTGRRPVWPRRSQSGAIVLPEGADALTVRVYTIRAIRPEADEIDVDVVRHAGGAVSDWAETVEPGAAVGILGPGGGYFPGDDRLLIGGDETALPAIARILENRPAGAETRAIIGLRHAEARLDLAVPDGVSVEWLVGDEWALVLAMKQAVLPDDAPAVWFASEYEAARALKAYLRIERELPAGRVSCAGYWRRETA